MKKHLPPIITMILVIIGFIVWCIPNPIVSILLFIIICIGIYKSMMKWNWSNK